MSRERPDREAGFTLVETLVCLALAGLIGVLLLNAVRIAGGASAAAARAAGAEEVQSVRDHLRRTLGSLAQRRPDGSRPTLRGGPDGLVAALAPDQTLERPTELAVTLSRIPGRDGTFDLLESRAEAEALPGQPAAPRAEVILGRIAGLALRYYGAPSQGARPSWWPAWSRPDRPPLVVEIQVAFPPADRRRWPPLLIALESGPVILRKATPPEAGPPDPSRPEDREAGFVLLSVLAVFIVVGAVLAAAILQVRSATGLAQARTEAVRLQGEADGIARLIAYQLDIARTYRRPGSGLPEDGTVTACPLAPGRTAYLSLQDQGTLIDLNATPRPAMEEAFRLLGIPDREVLALAAEIVDYRDPDDVPEPNGGAELPQYRARGLPWGPRNAPFASIDEVDRLPSLTPAIAARLRPVLTVYNEGGRFDLAALVRRANPSAIRSLPGSAGPVPSPRQVFRLSVVVEEGRARAGRSALLTLGGSGFLVWQQTVAPDLAGGAGHPACALIATALADGP